LLLPSLDSDVRAAFGRVQELAGGGPTILAEDDDMAMLRLLARARDALKSGSLVEHCRIPGVSERVCAIVRTRRFPNRLPAEVPGRTGAKGRDRD